MEVLWDDFDERERGQRREQGESELGKKDEKNKLKNREREKWNRLGVEREREKSLFDERRFKRKSDGL